jgi:eukaryotic-like serine/threonine-protein kinase
VATLANAVQYVGAAKANLAWVALRDGREAEAEELGKAALGCWAPLANAYAFKMASGLAVALAGAPTRRPRGDNGAR